MFRMIWSPKAETANSFLMPMFSSAPGMKLGSMSNLLRC